MKNTQIRQQFFSLFFFSFHLFNFCVKSSLSSYTHIFSLGASKKVKNRNGTILFFKKILKVQWTFFLKKKIVSCLSFAYVLVNREKFQRFSRKNCNWIKSWQCNWWWKVDVQDSIFALEWPSSSLKRSWQNTFHR